MLVASCFLGLAPLTLAPAAVPAVEPPPILSASAPALQSHFRYSYVQAGPRIGDATGFGAEVVHPLEGQWVAVGRIDLVELSESGVDADLTRLAAGIGYVTHLEANLDVIVSGQLEYADVDVDGGGSDDDLGIRVRGGARYLYTGNLEFFGGLSLFTTLESDFAFDAGAVYHFDHGISVVGRLEHDEDDVLMVGVRYHL